MAGSLGGILAGANPIEFSNANPLPLFLVQAMIIIVLCRVLQFPLSFLRQPRVIAEVLGGIILGPTVMGRIPNFTATIFPSASLPFINLVANFGLVFFLFLVGLELDPGMLLKSARRTVGISLAGMAVPFGTGIGVAYALYTQLDESYKGKGFISFALFCGIAMSITAFPVLARILSELNMLKTFVGSITISAAAVDDAAAWCLLALVIAIVNASQLIFALYIMLVAIGYVLFLILVVRPLFIRYFIPRFYNPEIGPSQFVVTVIVLMVFLSAFFTDALGIHAIFGGFVIGVIMPHEGGFAIKLTEKIEDLVTVVFLPLYFALSGLRTEIGLLNDGRSWGMVILVILVAVGGKVFGCTTLAKVSGMTWREAVTVGFLMSCKGLVELIVLNIGLDAGVIDKKVFAIMVLMALVTTFITTPIVMALYPPKYWRTIKGLTRANSRVGSPIATMTGAHLSSSELLVCLTRMRQVPAIMQLIRVMAPRRRKAAGNRRVVHTLRLVELGQRESAVMRGQEVRELIRHDPVSNVLRAFGQLSGVTVDAAMTVAEMSSYPNAVADHALDIDAGLVVVPWTITVPGVAEGVSAGDDEDMIMPTYDALSSVEFLGRDPRQSAFVSGLFDTVPSACAVVIDRGLGNGEVTVRFDSAVKPKSTPAGRGPHTMTSVAVAQPEKADADDASSRASMQEVALSGGGDASVSGRTPITFKRRDALDDDDEEDEDDPLSKTGRAVVFFFGGADDRHAIDIAQTMARNGVRVNVVRYHSPGEVIPESVDQQLFTELNRRITVEEVTRSLEAARQDATERAHELSARDVVVIGRGEHDSRDQAVGVLGTTAAELLKAGCRASLIVVRGPLPHDAAE